MRQVGEIGGIFRYPVKSFAGEPQQACRLERYGLYGDRFGAFHDGAGDGWDSYITARDMPELLAYKAGLIEDELVVAAPDGRSYGWNEALLEKVREHSSRHICMTDWRAPNFEHPDLMSVDIASVLIVSDASVRALEAMWGKPLDIRRFRPNLVVKLTAGDENEQDWFGKRLRIGEAELHIFRHCERCSMITLDPDTLERDPSLLRLVNERLDLRFGVYASVVKTGCIRMDDPVSLV